MRRRTVFAWRVIVDVLATAGPAPAVVQATPHGVGEAALENRRGRSNVWRFLALALCLVFAPAAAQAQNRTSLAVNANAGLNFVSFTVQTATASTITISIGTDTRNQIGWHDDALKGSRQIKLSPLSPNTQYFYSVKAVSKRGLVSRTTGQFKTDQMHRPNLTVSGNAVLLNGVKIYLIMGKAFNECPSQQVVSSDVSVGVQYLYHHTWYGCPDENHQVRWLPADELHGLLEGQLGWIQDGSRGGTLDSHGQQLPSWDGLPELVNVRGQLPINDHITSPTLVSCEKGWSSSATSRFEQLHQAALSHPVVYPVYLTKTIGSNRSCLTGEKMTVVAWMPPLAGAIGAEYLTQNYALPLDGFDVDSKVQAAGGMQTKHLAAVYPCLFGGRAVSASSNNRAVKVVAKSWGGGTCIFALNTGGQTESAHLKAGNGSSPAKVFWESRSALVTNGSISNERLDPYELHVYWLSG